MARNTKGGAKARSYKLTKEQQNRLAARKALKKATDAARRSDRRGARQAAKKTTRR